MFEKNPRKALVLGITTILLWSTVATASSYAMQFFMPMQMISIGLTLSSILLAFYLLAKGEFSEIRKIRRKDIVNVCLQGSVLFGYYFFYFNAYAYLPAQIASPINITWAFVLVFFNAWFYKEKIAKGEFVGMFLAYIGVVIITVGGSQSSELSARVHPIGIASGIINTFFFAMYWMVNKKSEISPTLSLCLGFFVAGIWGLASLVFTQPSFSGIPHMAWFALFYLTIFEWSVPYITWGLALRLTNSVPTISSLSFFIPFLALTWVSIILDEKILISTLGGLILIVGGTVVLQKFKKTHN